MAGAIKLPVSPEDSQPQLRLLHDTDAASVSSETIFDADAADIETASAIALDTSLPNSRKSKLNFMKRLHRKQNCCMCCGMNCSLFCKALGLFMLLAFIWNIIKFTKWMLTPTPTGLENMPEFSTSFGCLDAQYYYDQNKGEKLLNIPYANVSNGELSLKVGGGAPGTITLVPGPAPGTVGTINNAIQVQVVVRSSLKSYLDGIALRAGQSSLQVRTPPMPQGSCARTDVKLYIPPSLNVLKIAALMDAQVKFDYPQQAPSQLTLDTLVVTIQSTNEKNLLLGSAGIAARSMSLASGGGYISGEFAVGSDAKMRTTGSTVVKADYVTVAVPNPSSGEDWDNGNGAIPNADWNLARLSTTTSGKTTLSLANPVHRPLSVSHVSTASGSSSDSEMRLDYKRANFNGPIQLKSNGYSMSGVQSDGIGPDAQKWAGNRDGVDRMNVQSGGWVGLYV